MRYQTNALKEFYQMTMLHIGRDFSVYEMNTKFENILLVSIETLVELLHNNSEAYSVNQGIAVLKLTLF